MDSDPYAQLARALADVDAHYGRIADALENTLDTANRILNGDPSQALKQPLSDDSQSNTDADTNAQ